ncbi:DUF4259 domain-containing protein [Deinococcus yavapaiensis]|uniref:Uncharacterized protein DUF4259 n=1 Tax=Deinococcus yavapaiensis KR-236 TaxID=694435 RepID=A0A318SGX4_9DEIO|nr:DUF4259 domain-containing protein [Deinococcus yavapaiensis]PYE56654.1 uncharacterized protein DUF4259 [Deinococcus yavapaiensis KR-236]
MAAWGTGVFENDEATRYLAEVLNDGPVAVWEALEIAVDEDDFLEVPEGMRAVAAAELVAVYVTGDWSRVPMERRAALSSLPLQVSDDLRSLALDALERVTAANSDVRDLWAAEGDDFGAWLADVEDVRRRLRHS